MFELDSLKKIGDKLFKIYEGIGTISVGLLAGCVIFAVIARYFFSLSWKQLAEFTTTLFAFTTFWGMGICVLTNDHIVIDVLYNMISPKIKRFVAVLNDLIMLIIDLVFFFYSISYVKVAGEQISFGMGIPMKYMYGIMPVCGLLCAVCILIKIIENLTAPVEAFKKKV